MMPKLILIEGIPGSGKSTFARFLSEQFERNGLTCKLYLETTFEHPIIETTGNDDHGLFFDDYINRWSKFLDSYPNEDIVVMESAFFQSPIVHFLHKDVDRELIKKLIYKVNHLLSKVECQLIYFYQQDAASSIHKMIEKRGGRDYLLRKYEEYGNEPYFLNRQELGIESYKSFFLEYSVLANEIVKGVTVPAEIIENSAEDYDMYQKYVLDKYNLKHIPDPVLELSLLKTYSGIYLNKEMDLRIYVELKDDDLWIFGNKRMNPKGLDQFYLSDMSVMVNFIKENFTVTGLVINEKDLFANRRENGTVFERV